MVIDPPAGNCRITSYNVCYTKLLRSAGSVQEPVGSPMYEVKQGDTLYQIALSQGVSINQLFQANPDLRWGLKTGQRLVIPSHDPTTWIAHPSRPDSIYSVFAHNGLTVITSYSIHYTKLYEKACTMHRKARYLWGTAPVL